MYEVLGFTASEYGRHQYMRNGPRGSSADTTGSSQIVDRAKAINTGLMECCEEDTDVDEENDDGKQYKHWECKGKSPLYTSFLSLHRHGKVSDEK